MKRTISSPMLISLLAAAAERERECLMLSRRMSSSSDPDDVALSIVAHKVADELRCFIEDAKAMVPARGAAVAFYSLSLEVSPSPDTILAPSRSSSS